MSEPLIRVLVTGGRDYTDRAAVTRALNHLGAHFIFGVKPEEIVLVHGDCKRRKRDGSFDPDRSADQLAAQEAADLGWDTEPHPVDWDKIPPSKWSEAGRSRNKKMVDLGAHYLIAFPGGSGTKHCRRLALAAHIPVIDVKERSRV
jgi:hypothetical protein